MPTSSIFSPVIFRRTATISSTPSPSSPLPPPIRAAPQLKEEEDRHPLHLWWPPCQTPHRRAVRRSVMWSLTGTAPRVFDARCPRPERSSGSLLQSSPESRPGSGDHRRRCGSRARRGEHPPASRISNQPKRCNRPEPSHRCRQQLHPLPQRPNNSSPGTDWSQLRAVIAPIKGRQPSPPRRGKWSRRRPTPPVPTPRSASSTKTAATRSSPPTTWLVSDEGASGRQTGEVENRRSSPGRKPFPFPSLPGPNAVDPQIGNPPRLLSPQPRPSWSAPRW